MKSSGDPVVSINDMIVVSRRSKMVRERSRAYILGANRVDITAAPLRTGTG
jgi:hypothetical protein